MGMTRRDYYLIADTMKRQINVLLCDQHKNIAGLTALYNTVRALANSLAENNPRFDKTKFYDACGV